MTHLRKQRAVLETTTINDKSKQAASMIKMTSMDKIALLKDSIADQQAGFDDLRSKKIVLRLIQGRTALTMVVKILNKAIVIQ